MEEALWLDSKTHESQKPGNFRLGYLFVRTIRGFRRYLAFCLQIPCDDSPGVSKHHTSLYQVQTHHPRHTIKKQFKFYFAKPSLLFIPSLTEGRSSNKCKWKIIENRIEKKR
jgi:hypothetical protein